MSKHLMTPEEWASLSAESRHKINVLQMECEKMQATLRALWTSRPAGLAEYASHYGNGAWIEEMETCLKGERRE